MSDDLKKFGLTRGEVKLQLTKEEDVKEYPGRKNIRELVEKGFTWSDRIGELPHMVIWGDIGAGKTHLLHYVRRKFRDKTDFDIKVVEFIFEPDDKTIVGIYRKIVYGLGKSFVKQLCLDFFEELRKNTDGEGNLLLPTDGTGSLEMERKAFDSKGIGEDLQAIIKFLWVNQNDAGPLNLAWKWFSAEKLTTKDKTELKVNHDTSNESDVGVRLEEIFKMNHLAYSGKNRIVIFADEADQISKYAKDGESVTALLRKMLELPSCSVIIAATSTAIDDLFGEQFMAIMRRMALAGFDGSVELPMFDNQDVDGIYPEIREYVVELLKTLRPQSCSLSDLVKDKKDEDGNSLSEDIFPFTEKAITRLVEWCNTRTPEYSLHPGRISDALTYGLQTAIGNNKEFVDVDCFN